MSLPRSPFDGLSVFERGWLSCNNVLLHGDGDGAGATLVDTSHHLHAAQTIALVRQALRGEPLARVVNTHLHSDHCGGNAAVQREFQSPIFIPPGSWDAVAVWDEDALGYRPNGHHCERFQAAGQVVPGQAITVGGRQWEVLAAPGHDPDSVVLFDAHHGVLISADALWENGFGVVFPELDGERAFDHVHDVLTMIGRLPVQWVIPGHGAPFQDVPAALHRAQSRLAAFVADPARHARHAVKALLTYRLLEVGTQALPDLRRFIADTPLMLQVWHRQGQPERSPEGWCDHLLNELMASGVLLLRGGWVHKA